MNTRFLFPIAMLSLLVLPVLTHAAWVTNGVAVSTASLQQIYPAVVSDGASGAIIAWQDHRGADFDIYVQRVGANGVVQWTGNGVPVCTATGNQSAPRIVSDGAGGAIITWYDFRNGVDNNIYAQRVNASGVVQWTGNGVAVCTATDDQASPVTAADGLGGIIISWNDNRNTTDYNIYVQRLNASGNPQYATNGVAACSAAGNQFVGAVVSNGSGAAIVVWSDGRSATDDDIYAQRVNSIGGMSWTTDGVALCTATGDQDTPTAVGDGAGGAIVTWEDLRGGPTFDIYAQRVNSSGAIQWTGNGVAVCTAAEDQSFPTIATDGAAGAIITWYDVRDTGFDPDIYAQHVNASGAMRWTTDGIALCTATSGQSNPKIISDGAGGAIVAWDDGRNGNPDVYAQHVNSAGAIQWAADGAPVTDASAQQSFPDLVLASGSDAIFAWSDFHNDIKGDIYAVRLVGASGTVPTAVGGTTPPLSMAVSDNWPNPFSTGTTLDLTLHEAATVNVEVFDATGRRVRTMDLGRRVAGASEVFFNGLDDHAHALPSGVYFLRVHAGNETVTRKMVIAH